MISIKIMLMKLWDQLTKICRRIILPQKYCFYIEAELSDHRYKKTMTDMRLVSKSLTTKKTIDYLVIMTKESVIVHDNPDGYKVVVISENDMEMINAYIEENGAVSEDEKLLCIWFDLYVDEDRFEEDKK